LAFIKEKLEPMTTPTKERWEKAMAAVDRGPQPDDTAAEKRAHEAANELAKVVVKALGL
jgi:hypothetical protein